MPIGDAFGVDVEDRTVDRFKHRRKLGLGIDIRGRRDAKRPGERRRHVATDRVKRPRRSAIRIVMASTGQGGKQPLTEPPFLSVDSSYAEMKWVRGGTSAC